MAPRKQIEPLTSKVVFWFAFLGPLGDLVPMPGLPASFRFYYLLLLPAILLYLCKGLTGRAFRSLLVLAPAVIYMMISSAYAYFAGINPLQNAEEGNPLLRFALLVVLLIFTVCAGDEAAGFSEVQKLRVVVAFMKGYLLSLFIGYVFFIGYYARIFSLEFLSHFEILVQKGFGLLRFSPGSYPNEYGIVSSFALSILTLLFVYRRRLRASGTHFFKHESLPILCGLYIFTLGALFLATTRAAYISYLLSLAYIGMSQGGFRKSFVFLGRVVLGAIVLLLCVQPFFNVIGIFVGGYEAFFNQQNFGNGRINAWSLGLGLFSEHPYLGAGFGAADMIHNVYLQMFFGLGILGFSLLLATCIFLLIRAGRFRLSFRSGPVSDSEFLFRRIRNVALLHVFWFAFSNHNLNHFLTWFAVLLTLMGTSAHVPAPFRRRFPAAPEREIAS